MSFFSRSLLWEKAVGNDLENSQMLQTRQKVFQIVQACHKMSQNVTKCLIQTHRCPNGLVSNLIGKSDPNFNTTLGNYRPPRLRLQLRFLHLLLHGCLVSAAICILDKSFRLAVAPSLLRGNKERKRNRGSEIASANSAFCNLGEIQNLYSIAASASIKSLSHSKHSLFLFLRSGPEEADNLWKHKGKF